MNLLIIGAGQYGMVVREIAQATGRFDKIDFLDDNNAVAIDSTNNISTIGSGCVIEPKAVIHTDVRIGDGCFISAGAVVNHNSVVEDTCHINCGAIIASGVIVPKGTKVDYGLVFTGEK